MGTGGNEQAIHGTVVIGTKGQAVVRPEDGEQTDGLMRPLMRAAFVAPEIIETPQPLWPCLVGGRACPGNADGVRGVILAEWSRRPA